MASEYKKRGGGYTTDKEHGQDESQENLSKWTEEEWQTREGSGNAKQEDGTQKRYLPKKAWEQMDDEEKDETEQKKQAGSKSGKQFVQNTSKAKQARSNANKEEDEKFESKKETNGGGPRRGRSAKQSTNSGRGNAQSETQTDKEEDEDRNGQEEEGESGQDADNNESPDETPGQKRGAKSGNDQKPAKKQKVNDGKSKGKNTVGSKHDSADEPAPAGSSYRLPKKGQRVSWKALPGWVHGEVTEIVTQKKQVDGKSVKASKEDPRIVLKSDSGKVCVHRPQAVHFED